MGNKTAEEKRSIRRNLFLGAILLLAVLNLSFTAVEVWGGHESGTMLQEMRVAMKDVAGKLGSTYETVSVAGKGVYEEFQKVYTPGMTTAMWNKGKTTLDNLYSLSEKANVLMDSMTPEKLEAIVEKVDRALERAQSLQVYLSDPEVQQSWNAIIRIINRAETLTSAVTASQVSGFVEHMSSASAHIGEISQTIENTDFIPHFNTIILRLDSTLEELRQIRKFELYLPRLSEVEKPATEPTNDPAQV